MDLIQTWLEIGKQNPWIKNATDPPFDERSFYECQSVDELIEKFRHGNWCLGAAFYYKNLCFINQIDGGDEWLTIRDGIKFESMSCGLIIERHGEAELRQTVLDCLDASEDDLRNLKYRKRG